MIQAFVAPRLKSIRTEDVVRFQEEYEEYRRHAREWQEGAGRYNPVRTPGYKSCVSTDLLLSMVTLSMFPGVTSIEQLTDDHVREWVLSKSRRETCRTAWRSSLIEPCRFPIGYPLTGCANQKAPANWRVSYT